MGYHGPVFFALSKTFDLIFSPLSWAIALLVVATLRWKKNARFARRATMGALGILVVFSLEIVENSLWRALETPETRTFREGVSYDAALLLGGLVEDRATEDSGAPAYNEGIERLLVTYDLLRARRVRFAVISGGPPDQRAKVIEARVLADQLIAWGIEAERVVVDPSALNTRDNAVATARIARERGFTRLVVVTSAFHMPRALGCFRAVGLEVDALPVDHRSFDPSRHSVSWQPRSIFLNGSATALRELAGRAIYRLRGYTR
jgi:uncharacterized SAM-binding protein YcdF (DUF218 family)